MSFLLGREKTVFMAHTGLSFQPVSYDLEHFNNREKKKKVIVELLNGKMLGMKWCVFSWVTDVRAKYDAKF